MSDAPIVNFTIPFIRPLIAEIDWPFKSDGVKPPTAVVAKLRSRIEHAHEGNSLYPLKLRYKEDNIGSHMQEDILSEASVEIACPPPLEEAATEDARIVEGLLV